MKMSENIYINLRLKRNQDSGEITLNTDFDMNAPNFFTYKNVISWSPTIEELDFINEAFKKLSAQNQSKKHVNRTKNIYVDLQIEKDQNSGELMLNIHFDKNAPNFSTDENTISWSPTPEELDFVNEAIKIFSRGKDTGFEKKIDYHSKKSIEPKEEIIPLSDLEKQIDESTGFQEDGDAVVDRLIKKRKQE